MTNLARSLIIGCSLFALTACGADDVVAPGGPIQTPTPTPPAPTPTAPTPTPTVSPTPSPTGTSSPTPSPTVSPTPSPTASPTPTPITPASVCTGNTVANGTVTLGGGKGTVLNCEIPAQVTGEMTLSSKLSDGIVYTLKGRTEVGTDTSQSGTAATLNITSGVTIMGGVAESSLIINRGSKIYADANANEPIIFTGRSALEGGATDTTNKLWGGIIINGKAPISDCDAAVGSSTVGGDANCWRGSEGIVPRPAFGGNTANDNSGVLEYVQVLFSGQILGTADEIQGITLNGVGSGTKIDYVQVHNSADDGIEIFGGTVNLKHLVLTGNADDTLDADNGYNGAIQFVLGVRRGPEGFDGDTGATGETLLEIDTSTQPNDASPRQHFKLANFTLVQNKAGETTVRLRGGADVTLVNGIIATNANAPGSGCFDVDDAATVQAAGTYNGTADLGPPTLRSVVFKCNVVYDDSGSVTDPDTDTNEATTLANSNNTDVNTNFTGTLLLLTGASVGNFVAPTAVAAASSISSISSFFTQVSYVGAFSGQGDTWTQGWTCNTNIADVRGATDCKDVRV